MLKIILIDLSLRIPLQIFVFPFARGFKQNKESLHYFHWDVTVSIVSEIARVVGTRGLLLARLNSTRDIHYGAGQGSELEPHYYKQDGRRKRFFDRADVERLFDGWAIDVLMETDMRRYRKPKICWELAASAPLS
ncbi:hypothetical protein [Paenibacillus cymbidii]|uniref:hypothetical protein n=1 Tax=Paenibacillus cymbidii TaxID=1639034 RepID=UPI001A9A7862|nr:hypothetical protein [Paenibacillus cymbidii]